MSSPNNGDANGDGTADAYETNVLSVESRSGLWSTIVIPSSTNCIVMDASSATPNADSGYTFPLGNITDFDVYCPTVGQTVPVTIILDKAYNTSGWTLQFFNPNTNKWSTVSGATFGTTVVGGVTKTTVSYNLTDGGPYDSNGVASGLIMDPVAIGTLSSSSSTPHTGYGQPTNHTNLYALLFVSFTLIIIGTSGLVINNKQP